LAPDAAAAAELPPSDIMFISSSLSLVPTTDLPSDFFYFRLFFSEKFPRETTCSKKSTECKQSPRKGLNNAVGLRLQLRPAVGVIVAKS
jgi:hypothetical protein